MFFKLVTVWCEHLLEIIAVMLSLHKLKKSHSQIGDHLKITKFFVTIIIHQ